MILKKTGKYALRAMAYLTILEKGKKLSSLELSEKTEIPIHYLSKIMRKLTENGLVKSQKGHNGGFELNISPENISFLNILNAVGYNINENCVFGENECNSEDPCLLHFSWKNLKDSFNDWSKNTTLADIINQKIDF